MFNHRIYLAKFLEDYKKGSFTNDSVARVDRVIDRHYQIIGVHHLTGEENRSKRNLFMDVVDTDGKRRNERIEWGWEGQKPSEHPNPVTLDKPAGEPAGNISIDFGQKIWARVLGESSDKVYNVTTQLSDEGQWNTLGHHSYYVVWLRVEGTVPPVPDLTGEYERGLRDGIELVRRKVIKALDS